MMLLLPDQALESIDNHIHQARVLAKTSSTEDNSYHQEIDAALTLLEQLVQQSYDCYTTIELSDGQEMHDDAEDSETRVTQDHLRQANRIASAFLVKIVSGEMGWDDEQVERAARLLAHLSGRGAAGAITRTWHIAYLDPNGVRDEIAIQLHEPSYVGNDIGFKTWGAAPLLAKRLVQQQLIPDLANRRVLELGTGTGLVGLVCGKLGVDDLTLTDYHPSVLTNVAKNVELNGSSASVAALDFIKVSRGEDTTWDGKRFDIVIASDLLYEMEHAEHLPVAIDKLMENEFHFMIPLRPTHTEEVALFESKMLSLGFVTQCTDETEKLEDEGRVRYRYYHYTRA